MQLKTRSNWIEILFGSLITFASVVGFTVLFHGISLEQLFSSLFAFLFLLLYPLFSAASSPLIAFFILGFIICIFLQRKYVRSPFLRFTVAIELLLWIFFGAWSTALIY